MNVHGCYLQIYLLKLLNTAADDCNGFNFAVQAFASFAADAAIFMKFLPRCKKNVHIIFFLLLVESTDYYNLSAATSTLQQDGGIPVMLGIRAAASICSSMQQCSL